jgi:hypothetical protein
VTEGRRIPAAIAAVALALALVLGGQYVADATAPSVPNAALTGQAVGRAGFAYLTGLRKFGAALLWNRLEPQMHKYYREGLQNLTFMLPSIKAIVTLDPQFIDAYYVAPGILIEYGKKPGTTPAQAASDLKAGLDLAKEGVLNNPKSGILLTSYAQLLWTNGKALKAALPYAEASLAKDVVWRSDEEQWDQFALIRDLFAKAGDTAREAQVKAVMAAIDANPNATKIVTDGDE